MITKITATILATDASHFLTVNRAMGMGYRVPSCCSTALYGSFVTGTVTDRCP